MASLTPRQGAEGKGGRGNFENGGRSRAATSQKGKSGDDGELAKPVFMPKRKRQELAEEEERKRKEQERPLEAKFQKTREDSSREAVFRDAPPVGREEGKSKDGNGNAEGEGILTEGDMETIRRQHLGSKEEKRRKVVKPSDRMKFHFDWDASEDTSQDHNPLYSQPHEPPLLFGRGKRAGIDLKEQRQRSAEQEEMMRKKKEELHGRGDPDGQSSSNPGQSQGANKQKRLELDLDQERTHWSEKRLQEMTERDWRIFKEDFNIQTKGGKVPHPLRSWDEASLPQEITSIIHHVGYDTPTPIQRAAVPIGLKQRDVIGIAETGSGKTAAFVVPMLAYIMEQPEMTEEIAAEGPYAVIMAPTRELALQIEGEARKFASKLGYRLVPVVGGQSIEEQGFNLRQGCEVVVGTPGRLIDCLERRYTVLNQCNYVVLDEADRMMDLGFEPQVTGVLDAMPSSSLKPDDSEGATLGSGMTLRTTFMFSATMPAAVERIARRYMRNPAVVNIGRAGKVAESVRQDVRVVKDNEKWESVLEALQSHEWSQAIVFVNTRGTCEQVARNLDRSGFPSVMLHGQKGQEQREAAMDAFRSKRSHVLVATDVAGRGIDVPDVGLVVVHDLPETIEQYTHRIGRTGRAGKKGNAVAFATYKDTHLFYDLKNLLHETNNPIPREIAQHEASKHKGGKPTDIGDKAIIH